MPNANRTWMPPTAGVLMIIAGILGTLRGVGDLFRGLFTFNIFRFIGFEFGGWVGIILGIIVIIAGIMAMQRKAWWLALIGAIIAATHFWLLGILAIIFVALSRKEFV
jgi:hypothetical protein